MANLRKYQEAFADGVSRVHTYLLRCAIIISLLFVLVEDRLFTIDRRTAELHTIVLQHDRELGEAASRLRRQYALTRQAVSKIEPPPSVLPTETLRELHELIQRMTPLPASLDDAQENDIQQRIARIAEKITAAEKSRSEELKSQRTAPAHAGRALGPPNTPREIQGHLEELAELRRLLLDYPAQYALHARTWTRANDGKAARLQEIAQLQRQSASLPTPFGGFDVLPSLALIGLAIGAFICLIGFYVNAFRLKSLAREALHEHGHIAITTPLSAPFWLATFDRSLDAVFGWTHPARKVAASVLLQLIWIGLIALLTAQCLRWHAADAVLFAGSANTVMLLYAFTICAGLLAAWYLADPAGVANTPGRRRVLKISGGVLASVAYVGIVGLDFGWWTRRRRKTRGVCAATGVEVGSMAAAFVANRRTGTLHHQRGCANHLPALVNRVFIKANDPKNVAYCLHRPGAALALLARHEMSPDALKKPSFSADKCFALVRRSLELNPHNVRLHDLAVKRFGTLKRYDLIEKLFADADERIRRALATAPENKAWLATRYEMEMRRRRLERRRS